MIKCHLSTYMGKSKMKVADVAAAIDLNRSAITSLYKETATRIDLATIDKLCELFNCEVGDLFERVTEDLDN